uniref:Macaca fascicularis brain cDNA clone: QorA-10318, similar to human nuclear receptor subfamily 1, group H, member 2 (NR1H2), mRNA, RefSeq: NM_007121.1 n=1 Tax=Macaca fascicularis TaxID=9541 RepID=I7GL14_MACFA|nr:unnamed protein product [Macaca fascicularis]
MSQALMRPAQPAAWTGSSQILKRSQSASERRAQPRRCWATSFAASAGTRPPASTTMCLAAKAARASSGAVWSVAGPGAMPAGAVEPARWTLSCGASASSSSASGPGASPGGSEAGSQGSGEGEGVQLTAAQELMIQQSQSQSQSPAGPQGSSSSAPGRRPPVPRCPPAALRPLHGAGHHLSPGDCGLCQASAWFPAAGPGGPDRPPESVHHRDHAVGDSQALQPRDRVYHLPEGLHL